MSRKIAKIEAEIESIKIDRRYLALNKARNTKQDYEAWAKFNRRLTKLRGELNEITKKEDQKKKAAVQYVEAKPAWRNQPTHVARLNQASGVSKNWVKNPKKDNTRSSAPPAVRNAVPSEPEIKKPKNLSKVSNTPARAFMNVIYKRPVKRTPREMKMFKDKADANLAKANKSQRHQTERKRKENELTIRQQLLAKKAEERARKKVVPKTRVVRSSNNLDAETDSEEVSDEEVSDEEVSDEEVSDEENEESEELDQIVADLESASDD